MGGAAEFVTDTSSGGVAGGDFERKFAGIESVFAELKHMLADCNINYFGSGTHFFAVNSEQSALRNRVDGCRNGSRRRSGNSQVCGGSGNRNSYLKLDGLTSAHIGEVDVPFADSR